MLPPSSRTAERLDPEHVCTEEQYLLYLRHVFAYEFAKGRIAESDRVLEIGCGSGYGTRVLSEASDGVVGLDVDEATVEKASLRYGSARCGFRHFAGDRTPFDACVFDIVVSFQVIEHVRDDGKFVTEVHRVLKPGGRFLVTTPNKTHRLKPGERPWNPFHVREYCPDELRTLLEAGFACVDVWGIRATDEIQRIERGRVARGRVLRRLDSLHLRRLLPRPWKRAMRRVLFGWREGYANAEGRSGDFRRKYHLADFRIMQQDLEDSLDLLGVCRKEG